jgi:hypothetical protein
VSDVPDSFNDLSDGEPVLAEDLVRNRPAPAAAFRGALGRYLTEQDPGWGPRPRHLWLLSAGLLLAGLLLLGLGALQATGGL